MRLTFFQDGSGSHLQGATLQLGSKARTTPVRGSEPLHDHDDDGGHVDMVTTDRSRNT